VNFPSGEASTVDVASGHDPMNDSVFSACFRLDANILVVTLSGELDIATAPSLRDQLLPFKYRATRVVYELGNITFLDLGGLRALLSMFDGDIGGVSISEPSRPVRRLLEIVELGSLVAKASVRAADDEASLAV